MQPNGFILVGVQLEPTALRQPSQTMLARFTFDGVLDTTFGTQGIAVATGSGGCTALAQLSNGGYPVVNAQGVVEFTASGSVASTVTRERSSPATEAANLRRRASSSRMAIIFLAPSSSSVKNSAFTTPPPRCFASLRPAPRTLASPTPLYRRQWIGDRGHCKRGFRSVEWGHCGSGKPDYICSKRNNYRQRLGVANAERKS